MTEEKKVPQVWVVVIEFSYQPNVERAFLDRKKAEEFASFIVSRQGTQNGTTVRIRPMLLDEEERPDEG
jgi:hypothetical protein